MSTVWRSTCPSDSDSCIVHMIQSFHDSVSEARGSLSSQISAAAKAYISSAATDFVARISSLYRRRKPQDKHAVKCGRWESIAPGWLPQHSLLPVELLSFVK
jgi:hypothetical protein